VNFQPTSPLQPNTTYEIVVRAGGIRDYSGNTVPETFRSRFSTGANLTTNMNTIQSSIASANPSRVKSNRSPLAIRRGANSKTQYRWKDKQVDAEGRSIQSRIRSNDRASTPN
jgi:Bacterial Ig-like domain